MRKTYHGDTEARRKLKEGMTADFADER